VSFPHPDSWEKHCGEENSQETHTITPITQLCLSSLLSTLHTCFKHILAAFWQLTVLSFCIGVSFFSITFLLVLVLICYSVRMVQLSLSLVQLLSHTLGTALSKLRVWCTR